MVMINQLSTLDSPSGGNNFPVWVAEQGDTRRVSLTDLITYIEANLGNVVATTVNTTPVTVANLPAAATVGSGARCFVTDANATTFNSVVAAGGANAVPVFSDGAAWRIG